MDDPEISRARLEMQLCMPSYGGVDDQFMVVQQTVNRNKVKNLLKGNPNEKGLQI